MIEITIMYSYFSKNNNLEKKKGILVNLPNVGSEQSWFNISVLSFNSCLNFKT